MTTSLSMRSPKKCLSSDSSFFGSSSSWSNGSSKRKTDHIV